MNQLQHCICLLLGANIQPEANLPRSVNLLRQHLTVVQTSSVWESQAVGSDGPNFLNAAVLAKTTMVADCLREEIFRPLEKQLGRVRTNDKNSPRPIDIDLILFDQQLLDPGLWQYAHCATPVAEILPEYRSNAGELLKDVAARTALTIPIWVRADVSVFPFATVFT